MYNPFWRLIAARKLVLRQSSFLRSTGWLESSRRGYPCDREGRPLPWMNYAVIDFLEKRLKPDFSVFEYGSGFSTLFYARQVSTVFSVEDNPYWFERMKPQMPENVVVTLQPKDENGQYCRSILHAKNEFDLVVIDGRDRINCIPHSVARLKDRGVILLDDSGRDKYKAGMDLLVSMGFRALDFVGMKPTASGLHRSTILYRSGNCFGV